MHVLNAPKSSALDDDVNISVVNFRALHGLHDTAILIVGQSYYSQTSLSYMLRSSLEEIIRHHLYDVSSDASLGG